jgi:RNA polymerase sigma-70 factor, ECF subfamily
MPEGISVLRTGREADATANCTSLELFEQQRSLLFAIAYRMTGTVADAEDMVQEAFIRWQTARTDDIQSPKAFLITIVSRLCINHLQSARVQRENYVGQWLPEPYFMPGAPDPFTSLSDRDSLSIAFLLLLERLTPVERAVFVLREVFEVDYEDVSKVIDKSEANCRQILRRARKFMADNRPRFQSSVEERDRLLREFLNAISSGNLDQLAALLAQDVVFYSDGGGKAVAVPNAVYGRDRVLRLITGALTKLLPGSLVRHTVRANGHLAVVSYKEGHPHNTFSLDVSDGLIRNMYVITNPDKLRRLPLLVS